MWISGFLCAALVWAATSPEPAPDGPGTGLLEGTLLDAGTGRPVAARLTARDEYGRIVEIDGKHSHVDYPGQRRCYADGSFRVSLPAGG